ncbi:Glutathione s-transferase protein [Pseudomonas savastanoi]|uniref:Glutathione s-transferase protein n=7 Tax=Pseudomonas syringae group TaxID=136849 RepID=A0A3M5FM87_PSESS|nr:Glutathione s-transferase protein [Pseudomonas savastanoi]
MSDALGLSRCVTDVVGWRELLQLDLCFGRHVQTVDESLQRFRADALAACQFFQFFVWVFDVVTAHDGLNRLCQNFPARVQIGSNALLVQFQLADAFEAGFISNNAVGKTDAQVAQYGGVSQVALPARDRQFARQMLEQRVGDAQIAFGVFEVDRVDLVWHGRRADFASNGALLEVAQGYIAPDIAVEVDQDSVETRNRIKQLGDVVMRFDLRGVRVEAQPQLVFDERACVGFPVDIGIGGEVGIVVADRTVDLAQQGHCGDLVDLAFQTVNHVGQFLAQRGRGRWLTVGTREHRHVGEADRQFTNSISNLAHQRQHHSVTAFTQHQAVRQVVDVLAGAGKVDELADLVQLRQFGSLLLEQILNGFDVVVGGALDLFHALGVLNREVFSQGVEDGVGLRRERRDFGNLRVGRQTLEPANFNHHTETDQAVFAENRAQGLGFAGVAAINRGNRSERRKLHGMLSDSRATKRANIIHEKSLGPEPADQRRQRRACGGEGHWCVADQPCSNG